MKLLNLKRISRGLAPPILVLMGSLFGIGIANALTPSGTVITNSASVAYQDGVGNTYTANSEDATVTVGSVFGATIENDELAITAAPNTSVNVSFLLTNNGNASDDFTVTFGDDNGTGTPEDVAAGTALDATSYLLFIDDNQNGVADGGESTVTSGAAGNVTVGANDGTTNAYGFPNNVAALVLQITVPSGALDTDVIGAILTAVDTNGAILVQDISAGGAADGQGGYDAGNGGTVDAGERDADLDSTADGDESVQALVTVSADAVLAINKVAELDAANNRITYTLNVTNNGAAIANSIRIVDQIPANSTFSEMEQINLSTAAGDRFYDQASGTYVRMTIGQDNASAPYDLPGSGSNLDFYYDSDLDGTVETNGDDLQIVPNTIDETGVDLNDDAVTGSNFSGIEFLRNSLAPTASVSIVYSVTYNPTLAAGTLIQNTFCVQGDLNNDATLDAVQCSNNVQTSIPAVYAVDIDDTDGDAGAGPGETETTGVLGDDEDAIDNNTQHEATAVGGEVVKFNNVVTNNGNVADSFELSISNGTENTFPAGTTFAYFIGGSSIGSNTGSINAGASVTITVQATLPTALTDGMATLGGSATVSFDEVQNLYYIESGTNAVSCVAGGANDPDSDGCYDGSFGADNTFAETATGAGSDDERFTAVITATSDGDAGQSNTKIESLGAIKAAVIDLTNGSTTIDLNTNTDAPADLSDGIIDDGDATDDKSVNQVAVATDGGDAEQDVANIGSVPTAAPGATLVIPLVILNEQGQSTSFAVAVDQTITLVPSGWTVAFRPSGGGATFNNTPSPVAEGGTYAMEAVVTISSNVAEADAGDYDFAFKITSNADATVTDTKVDRITVTAVCNITEGAGASDQIQKNGSVDYSHTITNNGNQPQTLDLAAALSVVSAGGNGLTGWTATIRIDTTGDGFVNEDYANLNIGSGDGLGGAETNDGIAINDVSAASVVVIETENDGSGNVAFTLDPGDSISFEVRVFAPSTAAANDKIRTTITIDGGCQVASIVDDSTVGLQVRIDKTVAVDPTCGCDESGLTFAQNNPGTVNPGECLIWRLTVTNDGTETAQEVSISDQITPYSVAITSGVWGAANPSGVSGPPANSLVHQTCLSENAAGTSCQLSANIGDATASGTDTVIVSGSSITFNVGAGADNLTGGTLIGSDSAVGQFCVQVQ